MDIMFYKTSINLITLSYIKVVELKERKEETYLQRVLEKYLTEGQQKNFRMKTRNKLIK